MRAFSITFITLVFGNRLPNFYLRLSQGGILTTLRKDLIPLDLNGKKTLISPQASGSQSVSPKPAKTSPGNLFKMHILGLLIISTASDLWGWSPVIYVLTRLSGDSDAQQRFRTSALFVRRGHCESGRPLRYMQQDTLHNLSQMCFRKRLKGSGGKCSHTDMFK